MISETEIREVIKTHGFTNCLAAINGGGVVLVIEGYVVSMRPTANTFMVFRSVDDLPLHNTFQEWWGFDETDITYRKIEIEWWRRAKPMLMHLASKFPKKTDHSDQNHGWVQSGIERPFISEPDMIELMNQNGFHEFVYRWDHEEAAFAIGVESHSMLFLPCFGRVALWPYQFPNNVRFFTSSEWLLDGDRRINHQLDLDLWARFKPVYLAITESFPADPLPSGFLKWIRGCQNVKWNKGVKVKRVKPPEEPKPIEDLQAKIEGDQSPLDKLLRTVSAQGAYASHLWRPVSQGPPITVEKRVVNFLRQKEIPHTWSDSSGEHVLQTVSYVISFDITNELITIKSRHQNGHDEQTYGWFDWLSFNEDAIRARYISPRAWKEIKPVIDKVVSILCGKVSMI